MFETSTEVAELFKALLAFQGECQGVKKTSTNPHFKSKYADMEEVVSTALPVMGKHGLGYTQMPSESDAGRIGVLTMVFHTSGQWMRGSFSMPLSKNDPQGAVAGVTYARRCALMAALGLAPEDDDGNTASQKPEPRKEGENRPSPTTTKNPTSTTKPSGTASGSSSQESAPSPDDEPVEDDQREAIKDLFRTLGIQGPGVAETIKKHTGKLPGDIRFADANKLIAELEKQVRLNKARAAQAAGEGK